MASSSHFDQGMLHSNSLGKCTNPHDDLGPDFDECPDFDSKKPSKKYCGACGCHLRFHVTPNLDLRVDDDRNVALDPKHKIFLSHSGSQKDFVEQLNVDLERMHRYAFFDKDRYSLPIGEHFPRLIFRAIEQCHVGVVVLSEEFFTSKWPMMELVAMVDEVIRRQSSFKIIPVFLYTSLEDIREDSAKLIQWKSLWEIWSLENPRRIDVKKWEAALKFLRPINVLLYNKLGEVQFRKVIVDSICSAVAPEVDYEVSHIQGRSRLCKVIQEKIIYVQQKDKPKGVCVVGLYGMGGIGKTSICKVLYNEFFTKFRGKVCHAELERRSKEEMLQNVLTRLTDTNPKLLEGLNADQMRNLLKRGVGNQPVFLALDNISDTHASRQEVDFYSSLKFMPGSVLMVTARSMGSLTRLMDKNNCLEMPELNEEEAKSLFSKSSQFDLRNDVNKRIIKTCATRCCFQKGDGSKSYHPLALDVLGRQMRGIDQEECLAQLQKFTEDIFNPFHGNEQHIFYILRKSFDTLCVEDQLLFMDVALFLPKNFEGCSVLEWLGLASVDDAMRRLERLEKKSLLERLGDGDNTRIGMHDLWRDFCVAESENGELEYRRWINETKKRNELFKTVPPLGIWHKVKRIAIVDLQSELSLEKANFSHFPNVTVLTLSGLSHSNQYLGHRSKQLVLDLSGLVNLKSLEVGGEFLPRFDIRGMPRDLIFLSLMDLNPFIPGQELGSAQQLIEQIGCLKKLQCLHLINYGGSKLPDMSNMVSLRVAIFRGCRHVDKLPKFSANLQILDLRWCEQLRGGLGVGDLVDTKELNCRDYTFPMSTMSQLNLQGCSALKTLPDLGMFPALSLLDLFECRSLKALSSSVPLTSLRRLNLQCCRGLEAVPDLKMFPALPVLDLSGCRNLTVLNSSVPSTALTELKLRYCSGLKALPDLRMFPRLLLLDLYGCFGLTTLRSSSPLIKLRQLNIENCSGLKALPDLGTFPALESLDFNGCWSLTVLSSSVPLAALTQLSRLDRSGLKALPDLGIFLALPLLNLYGCNGFTTLSSSVPLTALQRLDLRNCSGLKALPDLRMFPELMELGLSGCSKLTALSSSASMGVLRRLLLKDCTGLEGLPDLSMFPLVEQLDLSGFSRLTALNSSAPVAALRSLKLRGCSGLEGLPDLSMFPLLEQLDLLQCTKLTTLSSSAPVAALKTLELRGCSGLEGLPDLSMFPLVEQLDLLQCSKLTALSSSEFVGRLGILCLKDCTGLEALPDLSMFRVLTKLELSGCSKLTALSSSEFVGQLDILCLKDCTGLEALPDLSMFRVLTKLELSGCSKLTALSSSEFVGRLDILCLKDCTGLEALPDLSMFRVLTTLELSGCSKLTALSSSSSMGTLRRLLLKDCTGLEGLPDLSMFRVLTALELSGCSKLTALSSSEFVGLLGLLCLKDCTGLEALPDLSMFRVLTALELSGCSKLTALSSSEFVGELGRLCLKDCTSLEGLPDLSMFPWLWALELSGCSKLTALSSSASMGVLRRLLLEDCTGLEALPDLSMFRVLTTLELSGCSKLTALSSSEFVGRLEILCLKDCTGLEALPDLSMFRVLKVLELSGCSKLTALSSSEFVGELGRLCLKDCTSLEGLPDLSMFPWLWALELSGCSKLTALSSSEFVGRLQILCLEDCTGLEGLPDLSMFRVLTRLELSGCSKLTALSSSVTLAALTSLDVSGCTSLSRAALNQLRAFCPEVDIIEDAPDERGRQVRRRIEASSIG